MGGLEEKETPSTENPQQEVGEEPKETDKMLTKKDEAENSKSVSSPTLEKKKSTNNPSPNGNKKRDTNSAETKPKKISDAEDGTDETKKTEEIIDMPKKDENTEEKKISKEEREVKPKKIPIGGLKLPGFFMKVKPKTDNEGADGELLEKGNKEENVAVTGETKEANKKENKPRTNFGERLRNFFVRKPGVEKQTAKQAANGDGDAKSEVTAEAAPSDSANNAGNITVPVSDEVLSQKRGLLNAIKLPIANMIPKRKPEEDVELGIGKAGLASMETLDDSLKDQDCVDKTAVKNIDSEDVIKPNKNVNVETKEFIQNEEKIGIEENSIAAFLERIRDYRCSVDDALIALGILLFILLLAVIGYVLTHETLTSPPIRQGRFIDTVTSCGKVEGLKEDGAFAFRGIPYAIPPIGEQRWKPALLIEDIGHCWNGTLKAHNSSEMCTQMLGNGTIIGDEDCLYLDVITPHVRYTNLLPVIVLIGTETLTGPSPGILRPSARYARSHDVIFVRPNFRLGAFGFLAVDALTKEAYPKTSGNYGLSDIIAALKWIELNIRYFGGDPKSVTILGHRAGGTLVSALVTSPKVKDLYTRAWVSSSSAIFPGKPLHESEKRNRELMQALKCDDANCLRNATTEEVWNATPDTWLHSPADIPTVDENPSTHHEWLVLDGSILQQHPADIWKKEHNGHPILVMGTTAHESHTEKLRARYTNWTSEEVRAYIENSKIGALNLTDEAIQRYNATSYRGLVSMITDIRTICPMLTNARLQPTVPFYVVSQGQNYDQLATVDSDIQAILGRYEGPAVEQRRFSSSMQQLFYYYISHGHVTQHDSRKRVLIIGQDPLPQDDYPNCNFWISNDIVPRYARVD